jgi:hypothetical protein
MEEKEQVVAWKVQLALDEELNSKVIERARQVLAQLQTVAQPKSVDAPAAPSAKTESPRSAGKHAASK